MALVIDDPAERLPLLHPDELDDEQRAVYAALTGGPRARQTRSVRLLDPEGRLLGPFNAMLYSPAVGTPLQALGAALRFRGTFSPREREIAILVVAAHHKSDFEWYAHERIGREAGLRDEELATLRTGGDPLLADARERIVHAVTRSLVTDADLSDALYAEAVATLGRPAVVELVTLVGYYSALALQLRVFRVPVPPGEPAPTWD